MAGGCHGQCVTSQFIRQHTKQRCITSPDRLRHVAMATNKLVVTVPCVSIFNQIRVKVESEGMQFLYLIDIIFISALNRSAEFTSKPGLCPSVRAKGNHSDSGSVCNWDIDCPQWQKCCLTENNSSISRCLVPVPAGKHYPMQ